MYLNKESQDKKLSFNVLEYASNAKKAKNNNKDVINASIGMLYENEQLYEFKTVFEAAKEISISDTFPYGSSSGSFEYKSLVTDYFFDKRLSIPSTCLMTNGGTGAIYLAIKNYCHSTLVIPKISWGNYQSMAKEMGKKVVYYDFFKDGKFNITKLMECFENQEEIFLLLNTPAHNPTGYTIKNAELLTLYKEIAKTKKKATICFDIAYIDYANYDLFNTFKDFDGLILVAASFSKSMGIYGLRAGALFAFSKDKTVLSAFENATLFSARSTYSLCSRYTEKLVIEVLKKKTALKQELLLSKKSLAKKLAFFKEKAKENHIKYLPCDEGFFVLVDLGDITLKTLNDNGLYLLPIDKYYRISISAISKAEIARLVIILNKLCKK